MELIRDKIKSTFSTLKDSLNWSNVMQSITLEKVVVSVGAGRVRKDKQKMDLIQDRLKNITGQKALPVKARKSIASFKLREGEINGFKVTLRGRNMYAFIDKLIHINLPRVRDFRGISKKSVDQMGNLTIGIEENTAFLETSNENLADVFSLSVTIVSSAKNRDDAIEFFSHIGIPFKKD